MAGTIGREMIETRYGWSQAEHAWKASPLSRLSLADIAIQLAINVADACGVKPAEAAMIAIANAFQEMLDGEDIGPFTPDWRAIENSIPLAYEFRQASARRLCWASSSGRCIQLVERMAIVHMAVLLQALPSWEGADDADTFEVPLLDFLPDPARVIGALLALPFDSEATSLGILARLRDRHLYNAQMASGIDPENPGSRDITTPANHHEKSPSALARLYLAGSPFLRLLETPIPFKVPEEMRFEHCHIVAGTGHGKTQTLQKLIHADLIAAQSDGRSVVVIDSQGDLINKLTHLELFSPAAPNSLADRLIVIDPSDVEFPPALNLFDARLDRLGSYGAADRERVLNGVIELYELFFGSFLGAELTQKQGVVFKYLARLMLVIPDATIHTLMHVMENGHAYRPYMQQLDGSARRFFDTEFFQPSFSATKKQILQRLWGVLATPAFERLFTEPRNKLDLFEATNRGKIILVNTAKDLLKREGSALLGRFFVAMLSQAALERSTIPEAKRTPTFVYVDEAQEYFDDSVETILTQARKYKIGLVASHQSLDQLSPRLRSILFSNTSVKCAGGVSNKDARSLAGELRTTPEFIESMMRRGDRTEFALWVKNVTGRALRLSVPLGFLERQPTLDAEDYEALVARNRQQYCGTLAAIPAPPPALPPQREEPAPPVREQATPAPKAERPKPKPVAPSARPEPTPGAPIQGKGGRQHKYLQNLVKELAEQYGLKAVIEASLPDGAGQVDVLLERDGPLAAIEISVSTPLEQEQGNLAKCLRAGYPRVAVVLAKSKAVQARYRAGLGSILSDADRARVSFLAPEDLPDFIAGLRPKEQIEERVVRGYRVKVVEEEMTPADARARREELARVIGRTLSKKT